MPMILHTYESPFFDTPSKTLGCDQFLTSQLPFIACFDIIYSMIVEIYTVMAGPSQLSFKQLHASAVVSQDTRGRPCKEYLSRVLFVLWWVSSTE